jgi:hypothetical protein
MDSERPTGGTRRFDMLFIDTKGLEDKWRSSLAAYPTCAVCGNQIGAEEHAPGCKCWRMLSEGDDYDSPECTCGADELPILVFRLSGPYILALALHGACAGPRFQTGRESGGSLQGPQEAT